MTCENPVSFYSEIIVIMIMKKVLTSSIESINRKPLIPVQKSWYYLIIEIKVC